jgi:predicted transcriptional regulator
MDDFALGDRELDLAYTTVLTILRNLEAKELVSHTAEGKAHRYVPRVARTAARRNALTRVLDKLFHGSPEQLVAQLVQDEKLSAQDLKRLHTLLTTSGKKSGGAKP